MFIKRLDKIRNACYYIYIRKEETLMKQKKKNQKLKEFAINTASGIISGVVSGLITWLLTR